MQPTKLLTRIVQAAASAAVIWGCVYLVFIWIIEDDWHSMGRYFYVVWPSLLLAQWGVTHTWVLSAVLLPLYVAGCLYATTTRLHGGSAWRHGTAVHLLAAVAWFALGWVALDLCPTPRPSHNPFDGQPSQAAVYAERYAKGYTVGRLGWCRTYCFAPEVDTRGHYEGMAAGTRTHARLMGTEQAPDWLPRVCFGIVRGPLQDGLDFLGRLWEARPECLGGYSS